MEIKDNFCKAIWNHSSRRVLSVEYSFQEKNISDKINTPDQFDNEEFVFQLLVGIMEIAIEQS
jgi:hypothetical protein